jgi:hypothetical protein
MPIENSTKGHLLKHGTSSTSELDEIIYMYRYIYMCVCVSFGFICYLTESQFK